MRSTAFRTLGSLGVAWLLILLISATPAGATRSAAALVSGRAMDARIKPLPQFHIIAPARLVYRKRRYLYELSSMEMTHVSRGELAFYRCIHCQAKARDPHTVKGKHSFRFSGFNFTFKSHTGIEEYILGRTKQGKVSARIGRIQEAKLIYFKERHRYSFRLVLLHGCLKPEIRHRRLVSVAVVLCSGTKVSSSPSGGTTGAGTSSPSGSAPTSGDGSSAGSSSAPSVGITAPVASTYTFTVNLEGAGSGTVTGSGISCSGSTCTGSGTSGQVITLTEAPKTGSSFSGWGGACSGNQTTCSFVLSADTTASATFSLNPETVTVTRAGSGSGTVSGTGISCGGTCSTSVSYGQSETLTATPATGSSFSGWSGACTGTGTCTVSPTAATSVTATFTIDMETLTVSRSGPGGGSVSGSGISCGGTCAIAVAYGTVVSLSASTPWDLRFGAWQGAGCSGTGGCNITVTSNTTVGAPFSGYYETAGSTANTWTNYSNAGGTQGPSVASGQTIQVSCVIQGFKVSDGNTNWYRIAQSPWNSAYYVSADAFYNNGATSGSLSGTPFVDPSVPGC